MGDLEALAPQLGDALRFHDPVAIDGVPVNATIEPRDEDDLAAVLVALGDARCAAIPLGAGTQLGLGNPPQRADCFLSLDGVLAASTSSTRARACVTRVRARRSRICARARARPAGSSRSTTRGAAARSAARSPPQRSRRARSASAARATSCSAAKWCSRTACARAAAAAW